MSADGTVSYLRRAKQKRAVGGRKAGQMTVCRSAERNEERIRHALITLSGRLGETPHGSAEYTLLQRYTRVIAARYARPTWTLRQVAEGLGMTRGQYDTALRAAIHYAEQPDGAAL